MSQAIVIEITFLVSGLIFLTMGIYVYGKSTRRIKAIPFILVGGLALMLSSYHYGKGYYADTSYLIPGQVYHIVPIDTPHLSDEVPVLMYPEKGGYLRYHMVKHEIKEGGKYRYEKNGDQLTPVSTK